MQHAPFRITGMDLSGYMVKDAPRAFQPSNGILFAVDDFDAAVSAIKARGIPIHMERETPVCFMAMISDPEGNTVTLHKRKVTER
jgi:predicted enzyme related to lactoylglutathione lyase